MKMNDDQNHQKIAAEFRRLREAERRAAPAFIIRKDRQLNSPSGSRSSMPVRFALAAAVVLFVLAGLLNLNRNGHSVDSGNESGQYPEEFQMTLAYEMPTDFLLDTAWDPLASTVPEFQIATPSYEYLEETSDDL